MTILPFSTSTTSEKLRTILLVVVTSVASSDGEDEEIVGAIESILAEETLVGKDILRKDH